MDKARITVAELLRHYAAYNAPDVYIEEEAYASAIWHFNMFDENKPSYDRLDKWVVDTFRIDGRALWIVAKRVTE